MIRWLIYIDVIDISRFILTIEAPSVYANVFYTTLSSVDCL